MNIVRSKFHGILDYFIGTILVISPWLFGFDNSDSAQNVPMIIGGSMLVYTVFTKYDMGIIKLLSFRFHLALDLVAGFSLVFSPMLFDFADEIVLPHVVMGFFISGLALITDTPLKNQGEWTWGYKKVFSKKS
ncbi:MAG: hypothetical protein K0S32_79 [Bacteroidetes bacterium]|jgi:drug/metabolite transporter (DMT)-like permease|nr:hypothetical protein [Bacteroidota bacterium]